MTASPTRPWATLVLAPLAFVGAIGAFAWWQGESLVLQQTVAEGRTVADLAENIGRWASQYGGVHVRTMGTETRIPGNFLTRKVYAATDDDAAVLQGVSSQRAEGERAALQRLEAYHWKNPALIQREVADVVRDSGSKARYRITAGTVLNPNNAPNAFEREAMAAMADGGPPEYWRVMGHELHYARAVVAQKSCLTCHASADQAPAFIRTNAQFNGGGGFGYREGKPAGVISVAVPLPDTAAALAASAAPRTAGALGVALLALAWPLLLLARRASRARPALRDGSSRLPAAAAARGAARPAAPAPTSRPKPASPAATRHGDLIEH
jgi:hypothetical protein